MWASISFKSLPSDYSLPSLSSLFLFIFFTKFCLCLPIIYVWLVRTVENDGKYASTIKTWLVVNGAGRKTPAGPQQKTFPYSWVGKPIFFFAPFFTGDVCSTRLLNRDISPTRRRMSSAREALWFQNLYSLIYEVIIKDSFWAWLQRYYHWIWSLLRSTQTLSHRFEITT